MVGGPAPSNLLFVPGIAPETDARINLRLYWLGAIARDKYALTTTGYDPLRSAYRRLVFWSR
jgi:hypothetical protein